MSVELFSANTACEGSEKTIVAANVTESTCFHNLFLLICFSFLLAHFQFSFCDLESIGHFSLYIHRFCDAILSFPEFVSINFFVRVVLQERNALGTLYSQFAQSKQFFCDFGRNLEILRVPFDTQQ